jgi:hypothetical protein
VTSGPSSDLQAATLRAAVYIGMYGMGRSLISASLDADQLEDAIGATLGDRERRKEVDAVLNECRESVRNLLLQKRHVVEGVRDALLEREELVGDEIEVLMAELGEREPIEVPIAVSGNGGGDGSGGVQPGGNGGPPGSGNGHAPTPPRPDGPSGG